MSEMHLGKFSKVATVECMFPLSTVMLEAQYLALCGDFNTMLLPYTLP